MAVDRDATVRFSSPGGIVALVGGVILPPLAWFAALNANWMLVAPACARGSSWPFYAVTLATFLLALAAGTVSWRTFRAASPAGESVTALRTRFLGGLGLLSSALFSVAIVAQAIASLVVGPCQ
jgi:hypothetical protein